MDALVRNFTFLFYGFSAAWVILLVYVFLLVSREKKLRSEIDSLRKILEERQPH
jgi:CcmD family protein